MLSGFGAHAAPMLLIKEIEGLNLAPPAVRKELQKTVVRVCARQNNYQLILGKDVNPGPELSLHSVEITLKKTNKKEYEIITNLKDHKKNMIIQTRKKEFVREEDILRIFEATLQALFERDEKVGLPADKPSQFKRASDPLPSTLQTKVPNRSAIDLRKIIEGLKSDTQNALADHKSEIEEDPEPSKEDPFSPKPAKSNSSQNQSLTNLNQKNDANLDKKKTTVPAVFELQLGWENRTGSSNGLVKTTSSAKTLDVGFVGFKRLRFTENKASVGGFIRYGKILDYPYEVGAPHQIALFTQGHTKSDKYRFQLGALRDSSFFINLATPGGGLGGFNLSSNWVFGKALMRAFGWDFSMMMGSHMGTTSDLSLLKDSSWSGQFYHLAIKPALIVKNWESNIVLEKVNLSAQGVIPFENQENRLILSISRIF